MSLENIIAILLGIGMTAWGVKGLVKREITIPRHPTLFNLFNYSLDDLSKKYKGRGAIIHSIIITLLGLIILIYEYLRWQGYILK